MILKQDHLFEPSKPHTNPFDRGFFIGSAVQVHREPRFASRKQFRARSAQPDATGIGSKAFVPVRMQRYVSDSSVDAIRVYRKTSDNFEARKK
jgi:hypothetical protein